MMRLAKMRQALQWNAEVYKKVRQTVRPGMTELELLAVVDETYIYYADRTIEYSYDLISGPRSGAIEGLATNRLLKEGDCIILDIQANNDGVWCDTTRTFFLGHPSAYWKKAYAAVRAALRAGEVCLRPGVCAQEVFMQVSGSLEQSGFPPLPHHAGHALGSSKLEAPRFFHGSDGTLQSGMMVTLEPGIYVEGENGMRLENNYLLVEDGFVPLFSFCEDMNYFIAI